MNLDNPNEYQDFLKFNENYVWVSDLEQHGVKEHWGYLVEKNGKFYGDCESYARTLKKKFPNLFKGFDLYFSYYPTKKELTEGFNVKRNAYNHVFLTNGKFAICSNTKSILPLETYMDFSKSVNIRKVHWFIYFGKMILTYVVTPFIQFIRNT